MNSITYLKQKTKKSILKITKNKADDKMRKIAKKLKSIYK